MYFIDADADSITRDCEKSSFKRHEGFILLYAQDYAQHCKVSELKVLLKPLSDNSEQTENLSDCAPERNQQARKNTNTWIELRRQFENSHRC